MSAWMMAGMKDSERAGQPIFSKSIAAQITNSTVAFLLVTTKTQHPLSVNSHGVLVQGSLLYWAFKRLVHGTLRAGSLHLCDYFCLNDHLAQLRVLACTRKNFIGLTCSATFTLHFVRAAPVPTIACTGNGISNCFPGQITWVWRYGQTEVLHKMKQGKQFSFIMTDGYTKLDKAMSLSRMNVTKVIYFFLKHFMANVCILPELLNYIGIQFCSKL